MNAASREAARSVLTLNGGSSSIRFAVHDVADLPQLRLRGKIDRIGLTGSRFFCTGAEGLPLADMLIGTSSPATAVDLLLAWLDQESAMARVVGVGHRIVHGMARSAPERIDDALLNDLRRVASMDAEHLPRELELIHAVQRRHPGLPQVACFDTAFHRSMPRVATRLPLSPAYLSPGVMRYGFHGLSCAYVMQELARRKNPIASAGRLLIAHLGNGASLTAVRDGVSVDTSMGFTPSGGLMMGSRAGDLDPGLLCYLAENRNLSVAALKRLVNNESGLLGVSGRSADLRDLLTHELDDTRAADAIELFCYQTRKWIGAFAAVLGGVDALVFTGGIGEHAASVRARICENLGFLGITLHSARNDKNASLISAPTSRVDVHVIPTDEEVMIATLTMQTLQLMPAAVASP